MQTNPSQRNLLDALLDEIADRVAAKLADRTAAPAAQLTLDAARERMGLRPSKGPDPLRSTRDRLRALGVPTAKVGRSILVDAQALEDALASLAKAPRRAPERSQGDELDGTLAAAGLRLVKP